MIWGQKRDVAWPVEWTASISFGSVRQEIKQERGPVEIGETLYVVARQEWRKWLAKHHKEKKEIWLIFYKKGAVKPSIAYEDAVEEAICYGWVDSQERSIDAEKYALRFTPRRENSNWVESNKSRALRMIKAGKMTRAGLTVLPPEILKAAKNRGGKGR